MRIKRTKIKGYHIFYISFFVSYFFILYFLLYQPNGIFPFQVSVHFFANMAGSISKRFLGEAAPYALLFFLIYHIKGKWLRISLISVFLALFSVNLGIIFYYFVARANINFYVLKGFQWNLFLSCMNTERAIVILLTIVVMAVSAVILYRIRNTSKVPFAKRIAFIAAFAGLTIAGNYMTVVYSPHVSVFANDKLEKIYYKNINLENSGVIVLANEIRYEYFRPDFKKQDLTPEEEKLIASSGIENKLTADSGFHPKKIVLITAESVNNSMLSRYNGKISGATPFIDSLIGKYPHMDYFYPSGTFTLYGLNALLCGNTSTTRPMKDGNYECLPNLMKKAGYFNEFIRGFSKYYVGENVFFKKIGYDAITAMEEFDKKYPGFKNERPDLYKTWGFSDNYPFDEIIERLKKKKNEKLFLTALTVDTHAGSARCYRKKTKDDSKNNALFSLGCFDEVLADFFKKLESNGLFDDDILIILTADHIYPAYAGIPGDNASDAFYVKPDTIPLVFISKKPIHLMAKSGSQVDLASTLLDLLNIKEPDYYMGKSLISNADTVPMGQDGAYAYMIICGKFMSFNLFNAYSDGGERKYSGDYLRTFTNNIGDINLWLEQQRQRDGIGRYDAEPILIKWFKNKTL
jgi:phosphoglycerol transferase MdoB-like AlkP superfamily enzyme